MAPIDHKNCFVRYVNLILGNEEINVPGEIVKKCFALPRFTMATVYKTLEDNNINDFEEAEKIFYLKNPVKKYIVDEDTHQRILEYYEIVYQIEKLRALPSYFVLYKILQCMNINTELPIKEKNKIESMNKLWDINFDVKCSLYI